MPCVAMEREGSSIHEFHKCIGPLKFNSMLDCVSPGIEPIISTWPLIASL